MKSYPYPIPPDALDEFSSGVPGHVFEKPMEYDGETIAANGLVCIRCQIGRWLSGEHPQATGDFLKRIDKLNWGAFPALREDLWHDLELVRIHARGRGQIAMRHPTSGNVQSSPIWKLGPVPARLSVLQAVAKLPRVEVQWMDDRDSAIYFRFSGGRGIIAADRSLAGTTPARSMFQDRKHDYTGTMERSRKQTTPRRSYSLPGWPPADLSNQ